MSISSPVTCASRAKQALVSINSYAKCTWMNRYIVRAGAESEQNNNS